jgi:hypothetical protein
VPLVVRWSMPQVCPKRESPVPDPRQQATIPAWRRCSTSPRRTWAASFWTGRYGRYAIRIDASRPGVYRWLITLEARSVRKGVAPNRDEAAAAVSDALDELPRQKS